MGDRTRRAIIECLTERPMAVGELAGELPVSQPAVSQHLKVLKAAGLVRDRAGWHSADLPAQSHRRWRDA